MGFLIQLLIFVAVLSIVYWVFIQLPLPPPFKTVLMVICAIIAIYWLLNIGHFVDGPFPRWR